MSLNFKVADLYVERASASLDASKVGDRKRARSESYGVLRALEVLVGLPVACHLIEEAVARSNRHYSTDEVLYDFWNIPRP